MNNYQKIILITYIILLFEMGNVASVAGANNDFSYKSNNPTESFLLEIMNIAGGIGVHAEIVSGYHKDLDNVGWSISLNNGGLLLIGKKRTGMIETLPAGGTAKIWSFVFGILGRGVGYDIRITVSLEGEEVEERNAVGEVIGPFVRNIFVDPHM